MDNKIVMISIAAVIGIIVLGSVLMPILDDSTATTDTFTNDGYVYMNKLTESDTDSYVLEWNVSTPKIIAVNGENVDVTTLGLGAYQHITIFCTGSDLFRIGYTDNTRGLSWIQIRGSTINYAGASSYFKAIISGGSVSINIDSEASPRSLTYTEAYVIDADKADYVMKKSNESAYMLNDSTVYAMGVTSVANGTATPDTVVFSLSGDMDSMTVTDVFSSGTVTISDVVVDKTAHAGYEDLYDFSKVTFTATESGVDTAVTYSYVIVPHEVTAERSVHFTPGQNAIFAAIPVMIILAVLLGVVALVIRSRMD